MERFFALTGIQILFYVSLAVTFPGPQVKIDASASTPSEIHSADGLFRMRLNSLESHAISRTLSRLTDADIDKWLKDTLLSYPSSLRDDIRSLAFRITLNRRELEPDTDILIYIPAGDGELDVDFTIPPLFPRSTQPTTTVPITTQSITTKPTTTKPTTTKRRPEVLTWPPEPWRKWGGWERFPLPNVPGGWWGP